MRNKIFVGFAVVVLLAACQPVDRAPRSKPQPTPATSTAVDPAAQRDVHVIDLCKPIGASGVTADGRSVTCKERNKGSEWGWWVER